MGKTEEKTDNTVLVTKHHNLIEAKYALGLNEQRLILTVISKIHPKDTDFQCYSFSFAEINEILNLKKKRVEVRKKIMIRVLESLQRNVLHITSIRNGDRILSMPAWIETPEINWDQETLSVRVSSALRPYLLQLQTHFSTYKLSDVAGLRSEYSIRFLEFCKSFEPRSDFHDLIIDNRYVTRKFYTMPELRDKLGLKSTLYPRPYNFKTRVLVPAQKEVNAQTSSHFKFKMIKTGREIAGIEFLIYGAVVPPVQLELNKVQEAIFIRLKKLRCPSDFSRQFPVTYAHKEEQVWQTVWAVEEYQKRLQDSGKNLKFPVSAVLAAYRDGWHSVRWERRQEDLLKTEMRNSEEEDARLLLKKLDEYRKAQKKRKEETGKLREEEYRNQKRQWDTEYRLLEIKKRPEFVWSVLPDIDHLKPGQEEELKLYLDDLISKKTDKFMDVYNPLMVKLMGFFLGFS